MKRYVREGIPSARGFRYNENTISRSIKGNKKIKPSNTFTTIYSYSMLYQLLVNAVLFFGTTF